MHYRRGLLIALAALITLGCPSPEAAGTRALDVIGPGIINNPGNKSLRYDILQYGLERFCFEMTRRGIALKTMDDEPVIGRFFAESCQSRSLDDLDRKSIVVQFAGRGYLWSNLTGRIGFESKGIVEYAPDFLLHESSMYVYFRPQRADAISFQTTLVESAIAQGGIALAGIDPNAIGKDVVTSQLRRGFTVIRKGDNGEIEFGLGYLAQGRLPFRPFRLDSNDRIALANDRTVIQPGQQDFVGGFHVEAEGKALFLTLELDGTPAVDVLIIPKPVGDATLKSYVSQAGPARPTATARLQEPVEAGERWKRFVPVPPGDYYMLLDHSAAVPPSVPGASALPAKVDYAIQLGDTP